MKPIELILTQGSRFYEIDVERLTGPRRMETIVLARFSIMFACRKEGHSLTSIGSRFNRDHGSVMNAIQQTTPEKFGGFWDDHNRFLERIEKPDEKTITELRGAAIFGLEKQITEISGIINMLKDTKDKLIVAMNRLTRFESASKIAEGDGI